MTAHKMVPVGLIEALQRQRQVDEDGTECGVNREAVDSAIGILQAIAAAPAPDVNPIDDPRLQEMFSAAIDGAHAYGYMGKNQPTGGHWLAKFWGLGRQHREAVDDSRKESAPAPDVCEVPRELLSQLREDAIGYAELIDDVRMHRPVTGKNLRHKSRNG